MDDIVRRFDRLPAGLWRFVIHLIAFEDSFPRASAITNWCELRHHL